MLIVGAHNERAASYHAKRHFERSRKIWLNIQHFKHPDFSTTSFLTSSKIPVEMTGPGEGKVNTLEPNIFSKHRVGDSAFHLALKSQTSKNGG
jgi:hypothetical protein